MPREGANRVLVAEGKGGSLAAFPPPHTFFFTREKDTNLGYVWYRKDADGTLRHRRSACRSAKRIRSTSRTSRSTTRRRARCSGWACTSTRARSRGEPTRQAVLAFTHGDTFKPVAGYKTFVNHFHLDFTGRRARVRIVRHADPGSGGDESARPQHHRLERLPLRAARERSRVRCGSRIRRTTSRRRGARRTRDFLVTPWEEPSAYFGGHYNIMFPKNVYWSKVRQAGTAVHRERSGVRQGLSHRQRRGRAADDGCRGRVLVPRAPAHQGHDRLSGSDLRQAVRRRTIGIWASRSSRAWGRTSRKSRMCEWRCFDAIDTMNNLYAGLRPASRSTSSRTSTRIRKGPEDDLYAELPGQLPEDRQDARARRGLDARC